MRVSAISGTCEAHGQCAMVDEELFTIDDEGYTTIGEQGVEVPAGKESAAQRGVDACPLQALQLNGD